MLLPIAVLLILAWLTPLYAPPLLFVAGLNAGAIGLTWVRRKRLATGLTWAGALIMAVVLLHSVTSHVAPQERPVKRSPATPTSAPLHSPHA